MKTAMELAAAAWDTAAATWLAWMLEHSSQAHPHFISRWKYIHISEHLEFTRDRGTEQHKYIQIPEHLEYILVWTNVLSVFANASDSCHFCVHVYCEQKNSLKDSESTYLIMHVNAMPAACLNYVSFLPFPMNQPWCLLLRVSDGTVLVVSISFAR